MEAHTHKTWILSMKCWIIWCAHPLVRLPLPRICMCVHKQIRTVADSITQHPSTASPSFIQAIQHNPSIHEAHSSSMCISFFLQLSISNHTDYSLPHTNKANTKFFQSNFLSYPHLCSTQPTRLLLPPTALDVLVRAFPIKLVYYEPSPLGWIE